MYDYCCYHLLRVAGGAVQGTSQIHMMGVPTTMQQSHTLSQVQQQQAQHQQGVRINMVCLTFQRLKQVCRTLMNTVRFYEQIERGKANG